MKKSLKWWGHVLRREKDDLGVKKFKLLFDQTALLNVYCSLAYGGISTWGNANKTDLKPSNKIHNEILSTLNQTKEKEKRNNFIQNNQIKLLLIEQVFKHAIRKFMCEF